MSTTSITNLGLAVSWLNITFGSALFIFGIIGNVSTIIIFTRPTFRNASSVRYLIASAVANFIQLVNTLLPRILGDGFKIPIIQSNTPYCQARNYIAIVATLCSISYPCWASFDHFVSTSRNAATRQYWTSKVFVRCAIFGTFLFWLLFDIPTAVFLRAVGENCVGTNIFYTYVSLYVLTPLTYSVLPIVAIIYFNVGIVRNLRQTRLVRFAQVNDRLVRQVRRMLIPQLLILVISGVPFSIQIVYAVATLSVQKDALRTAIENLILTNVRLLFYLNYVCSFYVYHMMSSEVRREVKGLHKKRNTIVPQGATTRT